jgi:hypothetical protein
MVIGQAPEELAVPFVVGTKPLPEYRFFEEYDE